MKLLPDTAGVNPGENHEGLAPLYFQPRTARLIREFCAAADVNADEWAEGWLAAQVTNSVEDDSFLGFSGIAEDLLNNYGPEGGDRPAEDHAEVIGKFLVIVNRERAELDLEPITYREAVEMPEEEEVEEDTVPLFIPRWMKTRLEQIAEASGINRRELVELEIGWLFECKSRNDGLMGGILDALGHWEFTEEEREACKMAFDKLCEGWAAEEKAWNEREIKIHPALIDAISAGVEAKLQNRQQEAAASVEGGEA